MGKREFRGVREFGKVREFGNYLPWNNNNITQSTIQTNAIAANLIINEDLIVLWRKIFIPHNAPISQPNHIRQYNCDSLTLRQW
jgi:hypothetical protein